MEYHNIAETGIYASRIGLGTWAIGGREWGGTDINESVRTIHAALDKGINLIDTAPIYGLGLSEEIVGKAVSQKKRENIYIATKLGLQWNANNQVYRNSEPPRIREEIEASLKRLRTDYIDIYQIHWPDPLVAMEEAASELAKLRKEGKIRAIGVSNFSASEMDEFRLTAPIHTAQPPYNLFEREAEMQVLPYCKKNDITTLLYSSLCRGLLSGNMSKKRKLSEDDVRNSDPKFQEPRFSQYLNAVDRLESMAVNRYGKHIIHLALRWVLDQPGANIALWGARHPNQLDPITEIWNWSLDSDALIQIDQILKDTILDPLGPEFLSAPIRKL